MGANQMGKSWLMRQHYFRWCKNNPDGYDELIGSSGGGYWIEGADLAPNEKKGQLGWTALYSRILEITNNGLGPYRNKPSPRVQANTGGLLRLEDAEEFLPNPIRGTPWQAVFAKNAHCHLDVQVNFHRPQPIDKNVLGSFHHVYVFYMGENYAREYISKMPELRDSEVMRKGQFPKKVGQYIHIVQDPSRHVAIGAKFYDDYYPELDKTGT